MADTPVQASNGKHSLGSARDADLEGIDPGKYDVFLTDKDLAQAKAAYPSYDWFVCFSVKDKKGNYADIPYTITLNTPPAGARLYYFYNGKAVQLTYSAGPNKGNQPRVRAQMNVGDPSVGLT